MTKEEIEAISHDLRIAVVQALAALRQLSWERDRLLARRASGNSCACRFDELDDDKQTAWCSTHAALRDEAAVLRAERDREDRLLQAEWFLCLDRYDGYCWREGSGKVAWVWNKDRAEAARDAEEKMNGK